MTPLTAPPQRQWTNALLADDTVAPSGLTSWNGSDPAQRFAVYRNNVVVSLSEALANLLPVCQMLVGQDFFRAMAREFIHAHPPRSPVLARYGQAFPVFAARFPPAASVPYLADMARLELALQACLDAADATPLAAQAFAAILQTPEKIAGLRIRLHPSARLVAYPHAVISLWAAHQGEGHLEQIWPYATEQALLWRDDGTLRLQPLPADTHAFLRAWQRGKTMGQALLLARHLNPDFDPTQALALVIRAGLVTALQSTGSPS